MKNCIIIHKPNVINQKKLNLILDLLTSNSYNVDIMETKYQNHATEVAEKIKSDLIISMGGDGTFHEVATGICKNAYKPLLTHIPLGTFNDVGRMFGYKKDPVKNLKLALCGTPKDFDVFSINDTPFTYIAGCGKFLSLSYETSNHLKRNLNTGAYYLNMLKDFFKKIDEFNITYEVNNKKKSENVSIILISNTCSFAGIKHFYDKNKIKVNDQQFEVMIFNSNHRLDIIKTFLKLKIGLDITNDTCVNLYKTNNFKLKTETLLKKNWCIDGERFNQNSQNYEIKIYKKIKLLVPKNNNTTALF